MEKQKLPTIEYLLLEEELYKINKFDDYKASKEEIIDFYKKLFNPTISIDTHCIKCGRERLFYSCKSKSFMEDWILSNAPGKYIYESVIVNEFKCSKDGSHRIYFFLRINQTFFTKIGQHPTIYDLRGYEIDKFRKILGTQKLNEFKTGIHLASHGNGIGSYTYLRRIIEPLIEEAHQQAKKFKENWDEGKYSKSDYKSKIGMLKGFLPDFLINNSTMYSILSLGIHELSENECKEHFIWLSRGIEYILTDKIRMQEDNDLRRRTSANLNNLHSKIKSKKKNGD